MVFAKFSVDLESFPGLCLHLHDVLSAIGAAAGLDAVIDDLTTKVRAGLGRSVDGASKLWTIRVLPPNVISRGSVAVVPQTSILAIAFASF
ncbi:MAG: hypothetical protein JO076_01580 [Verrucomicrobia bacterium]|nr:hypothetical protein [Verrucomicrobiota bacterium]